MSLVPTLRRIALATFRRFNPGDISIRHHYTGEPVRLHSFMHKGYWYYGRRREQRSMQMFARLISPGDTVVEVGGHIGYISLYFAHLVGGDGRVIVFEPGPNNLPYARANLARRTNVLLVESAASNASGTASFYVESLTGQNNSLLADYSWAEGNLRGAGLETRVPKSIVQVDCVRLDDFLSQRAASEPAFVKIDVEGAERIVLQGMPRTLRLPRVALMVEITEEVSAVFELLLAAGFEPYAEDSAPLQPPYGVPGNVFWVKPSDPRRELFRREQGSSSRGGPRGEYPA